MNIVEGLEDITILDDSYNSSPIALDLALATLGQIQAPVKIAVLGDMSELGKYTQAEHKKIAHALKEHNISYLITLGDRAEIIADEAQELKIKHVYPALSHDDAAQKVLEWAKGKTVVLVKGSQSSRMEKVSYQLLADKRVAKEVLVRQDKYWKS